MSVARTKPPTLLPGEAWTLLAVFRFLFVSTGLLICAAMGVVVIGHLIGWSAVRDLAGHPVTLAIDTIVGVTYVWIGVLLGRAKRLGGYLALGSIGLSLLEPLLRPAPSAASDFVFPALSLVAIGLCWRHLSPEGSEREPHTSIAPRRAG